MIELNPDDPSEYAPVHTMNVWPPAPPIIVEEPPTVEEHAPPRMLVDVLEASRILNTTPNNFRQLVFHRKVSMVDKVGRKVFYDRLAIERLRDERAEKVSARGH